MELRYDLGSVLETYVTSGGLLVDLFAIVPWELVFAKSTTNGEAYRSLDLVKVMRLSRLLKVLDTNHMGKVRLRTDTQDTNFAHYPARRRSQGSLQQSCFWEAVEAPVFRGHIRTMLCCLSGRRDWVDNAHTVRGSHSRGLESCKSCNGSMSLSVTALSAEQRSLLYLCCAAGGAIKNTNERYVRRLIGRRSGTSFFREQMMGTPLGVHQVHHSGICY